jgi:hypothetical protein
VSIGAAAEIETALRWDCADVSIGATAEIETALRWDCADVSRRYRRRVTRRARP